MDPYTKTFTVRWADCDANAHVRNTAYSEYCIDVRIGYLTEHGFGFDYMREHGFGPVILREEIDYVREVHMSERITVDFWQLGMSPDAARWKLLHEIWKPDGKKAARLVLTGGFIDLAKRKLTIPPPDLAKAFHAVAKAEGWEEMKPLPNRG